MKVADLLHGIVIETHVESYTGKILYSDYARGRGGEKDSILNVCTKIPFIGIGAGLVRILLGIIHSVGHLLAAIFTQKKGHLFHTAKGVCEILRGSIETVPIVGRIFANVYNNSFGLPPLDFDNIGVRSWWMIKIYNPEKPDGLDHWMHNWIEFPQMYYVKA